MVTWQMQVAILNASRCRLVLLLKSLSGSLLQQKVHSTIFVLFQRRNSSVAYLPTLCLGGS